MSSRNGSLPSSIAGQSRDNSMRLPWGKTHVVFIKRPSLPTLHVRPSPSTFSTMYLTGVDIGNRWCPCLTAVYCAVGAGDILPPFKPLVFSMPMQAVGDNNFMKAVCCQVLFFLG